MGDGRETEQSRKLALQSRAQRATVGPGGRGVPLVEGRRRRRTPEEQKTLAAPKGRKRLAG